MPLGRNISQIMCLLRQSRVEKKYQLPGGPHAYNSVSHLMYHICLQVPKEERRAKNGVGAARLHVL